MPTGSDSFRVSGNRTSRVTLIGSPGRDCGRTPQGATWVDLRLGPPCSWCRPAYALQVDAQHGKAAANRRQCLNERLRAAFIAGAEEDSRQRLGRGLTREELERVLRRYPGDVVT